MSEVFVCYLFNRPANKTMFKLGNKKTLKVVTPWKEINKKADVKWRSSFVFIVNPSCPDPRRGVKINANFYFLTSLWYLKEGSWNHFKVPERKVKIKIYIDFISTKSFLKITSNMFSLARREWFCLSTRYTAIIEGFFVCWNILLSHPDLHIFWATSKTWTRSLKNLDPEKPGSWKTWTLTNLGPRNLES